MELNQYSLEQTKANKEEAPSANIKSPDPRPTLAQSPRRTYKVRRGVKRERNGRRMESAGWAENILSYISADLRQIAGDINMPQIHPSSSSTIPHYTTLQSSEP